ncbi:MAG: hypothetical protein ABSD21_13190 [Rhizomicrobium sp.]|jgi:hypothetical protein
MWQAVLLGVLFAGVGLYLLWSRVSFAQPPRWSEARLAFKGNNPNGPKGDFGEILTAVILTQQGWRQLPSKLDDAGHGIDGVFIRPNWLTGLDILITETKVNSSSYKPAQLSHNKLIRALGDIYLIGNLDWNTANSIVGAMKRRSPRVRKEYWHHTLHNGRTVIQQANRRGALVGRTREYDRVCLMESLAFTLSALDRQRSYLEAKTG